MFLMRHRCRCVLSRFPLTSTTSPASKQIPHNLLLLNRSSCGGRILQREDNIAFNTLCHRLRSLHTTTPSRQLTTASAQLSEPVRLAKLIATHGLNMQMSRRSAEGLIESGQVTVAGATVIDPGHKIAVEDAMVGGGIVKVAGRRLVLPNSSKRNGDEKLATKTRVWLVNKLRGELVSEHDPEGRPSLLERMTRSGVGKPSRRVKKKGQGVPVHLKPVGRLDMMTEGLMVITNDGKYARDMELPSNALHRTYRARVHGRITPYKLKAIRRGVTIDGIFYKGMRVNLELNKGHRVKGGSTNSWLRISCVEGKNRQIRKIIDHVGLNVTRLIRTSFGDYNLNTIPAGLAIEVPVKPLDSQKRKGPFVIDRKNMKRTESKNNEISTESKAPAVQWIRVRDYTDAQE